MKLQLLKWQSLQQPNLSKVAVILHLEVSTLKNSIYLYKEKKKLVLSKIGHCFFPKALEKSKDQQSLLLPGLMPSMLLLEHVPIIYGFIAQHHLSCW